ncbi:site-2 protease family protein [Tahibacter amnicola]|uniref:Knr4/Smi1-like domain-containing protein n=1 Tax=Tahibacter amnicola TaxID=2976241 RepID=A0ABY6BFM4_9GAMM|nr:site-2 protease family protein [Tahibacter amnicola]UXI68826.1 hypothetical protein N4264_03995 [Tahibacter amnicola]
MFDVLALVCAIVLVIGLQILRNLLATVFPPLQGRRVNAATPPEAMADLHAIYGERLRALGFEGPLWYLITQPEPSGSPVNFLAAVYRNRAHGDTAWLLPPTLGNNPNLLNLTFASWLADGRLARTQSFDVFYESFQTTSFLAQTVATAEPGDVLALHRRWVQGLGTVAADPVCDGAIDAIVGWAGERHWREAVQEKKLRCDADGFARLPFPAAVRLLLRVVRAPKPKPPVEPVPAARLAYLAGALERNQERPVPAWAQVGLFVFSVALFMAAGGWLWGMRFAVLLCAVVAFHELGHYLAMRVFGYRNVQMYALPLVGGVTVGIEAKPNAVHRAWMSLMGPLPGIVLGWILLYVGYFGGVDGEVASWITGAAWMLLAVNYLNVLPVPPLDGAHVVQALLPASAVRLQAIFIGMASIGGAALVVALGMPYLAIIALLQLPHAWTRLQMGRVLRQLRTEPRVQAPQARPLRLRHIFHSYETHVGPTPRATQRITWAIETLRHLDLPRMSWGHRIVLSGVYGVLLMGPILAGAGWLLFGAQLAAAMPNEKELQAMAEKQKAQHDALTAVAMRQPFGEILRAVATANDAAAPFPEPATPELIAAAEQELGVVLPEELKALYRVANGVPTLGLLPIEQLKRVRDVDWLKPADYAYEGKISLYSASSEEDASDLSIAPGQLAGWIYLGRPLEENDSAIVYDVAPTSVIPGIRLVELFSESPSASPGVAQWVRERWIAHQQAETWAKERALNVDLTRKALSQKSAVEMLEMLDQNSPLARLVLPVQTKQVADAGAIALTQQRLGLALPDDLQAVLLQDNARPHLHLLPVDQFVRVRELPEVVRTAMSDHLTVETPGEAAPLATLDLILDCVAISGAEDSGFVQAVSLVWCPAAPAAQQFRGIWRREDYVDFTDYVRATTATILVAQGRGERLY